MPSFFLNKKKSEWTLVSIYEFERIILSSFLGFKSISFIKLRLAMKTRRTDHFLDHEKIPKKLHNKKIKTEKNTIF